MNNIVRRYFNRIIDRMFVVFGCKLHIRIEPPQFKTDVHIIELLIDNDMVVEAMILIRKAERKWGQDTEIARLNTMAHFLLP